MTALHPAADRKTLHVRTSPAEHRPGHDQLARDAVREERRHLHRRPAGVHPALPRLGLGRARSRGDLGDDARRLPARPWGRRTRRTAPSPASASPTSARPRSSGSARRGSRSTARSSGRTGARASVAGRSATRATPTPSRRPPGLLLDPYFSGTKIGWILDHVSGARAPRRGGRARLRHRRHVPDPPPERRRPCT